MRISIFVFPACLLATTIIGMDVAKPGEKPHGASGSIEDEQQLFDWKEALSVTAPSSSGITREDPSRRQIILAPCESGKASQSITEPASGPFKEGTRLYKNTNQMMGKFMVPAWETASAKPKDIDEVAQELLQAENDIKTAISKFIEAYDHGTEEALTEAKRAYALLKCIQKIKYEKLGNTSYFWICNGMTDLNSAISERWGKR